jgi:basic membrane protein A and related proteins
MTINKYFKVSGTLFVAALMTVSCTRSENKAPGATAPAPSAQALPGQGVKVGLVLDKGGKDDKSFNTAAFRGATDAVQKLGIELKEVESADDAAFEPALRTFAERGYPLVLAIGFSQIDAVKKVAPQFPKTHFAIVDGVVEGANVAALMFAEHEGSYLVGYLASLMSKTNKVGFIGGMDIALIRRFQTGYEAGAKAANAKTDVVVNYVGVNSSAWANPTRGKELALAQYGKGVDVIFHAAGASGIGLFDAADEKGAFVIGCDSNQNGLKPGRVVTSMLKRVDTAVFDVIKAQVEGKFQSGVRYFGLKDKGVDYAVDSNNEKLIEPYRARLEDVRAKIIKGEIKVPDYYEMNKQK